MLSRRRLCCIGQRALVGDVFYSGNAEGYEEEESESQKDLQRKFSGDGKSRETGSLTKVREFFDKYKPPPAPPPKAPKKKWLLQRLPEPEEVSEDKKEKAPDAGDVEAEKQWLNFGNYGNKTRTPLVTQSEEFRQLRRELESEINSKKTWRTPFNASQRYIPSFESDRGYEKSTSPAEVSEDWLHQGLLKRKVSGMRSYDELNARLEAVDGESKDSSQTHSSDGFVDIMSAMKNQQNTNRLSSSDVKIAEFSEQEESGKESLEVRSKIEETLPARQEKDQLEMMEADAVYSQLVAEDLSEEAIYSGDSEATKPYEYDPAQPRWLDPPDGDAVGAVPQREYNDFVPFTQNADFYNESSAAMFEDPGQDPGKPPRYKLYGEEYWVAKPMLMEKYDFATKNPFEETSRDEKMKDLDKEIPPHFVKEDGTIAPLSIAETQEYPDFFEVDSPLIDPELDERTDRLFTMNETWNENLKSVRVRKDHVTISDDVLDGYDVQGGEEETDEQVEMWLHETPTSRDLGYDKSHSITQDQQHPDRIRGSMKVEGYGRFEKFIENTRVPQPSKARLEEIKQQEGLLENLQSPTIELVEASLDNAGERRHYTNVSDRDLSRIIEAESRYQDLFSNEKSDELPSFDSADGDSMIESLRTLNNPETAESRPENQLLQAPAQADFDPWMLKELSKYRRRDGTFEDLYSLACHPRMLEIAYASLKKRRPGSVPRMLENNFFELASQILLAGELKKEIASSPKKPPKNAGKGARSTKIFSQPDKKKSLKNN